MVKFVDQSFSLEDSGMESVDLTLFEENTAGILASSNIGDYWNFKDRKIEVIEEGERLFASGAGEPSCCCCTARHCLIVWSILWTICLIFNLFFHFTWNQIASFSIAGIIVLACIAVNVVAILGAWKRNKFLLTIVLIVQSVVIILFLIAIVVANIVTWKYEEWKKNGDYPTLLSYFGRANEWGRTYMGFTSVSAIFLLSMVLIMTIRVRSAAQ